MIAPGVAELTFFWAGSERFFGKNGKKYEICDKAISITTVKATKFGMILFNGTYL